MSRFITNKIKTGSTYNTLKIISQLLIALFLFGTLGYTILKGVPLEEGLRLTIETVGFTKEIETDFLPRILQTSIVAFGMVLLWFILWTFFDLVIDGSIIKYFRE